MGSCDEFETYWLIGAEKFTSFQAMEKRVLAGAVAIEVSAESQTIAAEERERLTRENALRNDRVRQEIIQRQYEQSPEGQREAAVRTAIANPGGLVSRGVPAVDELEAFSATRTNRLR